MISAISRPLGWPGLKSKLDGTGVRVVQRYVMVFFLSAGVDEGVILPSGFLKDVTFRERVLAYVSHLLLPPLVVAGFHLPYL